MYYLKSCQPIETEHGFMGAFSNIDDSYIGLEERAKNLARMGIAAQAIPGNSVASIGFCEREQTWYGWSHRARGCFGIGSTVKRGDVAYIADTPEKLIEDRANFFSDINPEVAEQKRAECQILPDRSGIRILHAPLIIPVVKPEDLADAIMGEDVPTEDVDIFAEKPYTIVKCGRGEWTAKTLEDAKQMAIDFAEAVS